MNAERENAFRNLLKLLGYSITETGTEVTLQDDNREWILSKDEFAHCMQKLDKHLQIEFFGHVVNDASDGKE